MRRTSRRKSKKGGVGRKKAWRFVIVFGILLLIGGTLWHYRDGLAYYFSFKTGKKEKTPEEQKLQVIRDFQVLQRHAGMMVGIDVSEYQGDIEWEKVKNVSEIYPIHFVFIRATAGHDRPDKSFAGNWENAVKADVVRGAYHYYRPDENSIRQAELFIKTVRLKKGDLPPVLDIEKVPENQPIDSLKAGLRRWLNKVEVHYGVKPIIYTGEKYYDSFLADDFSDYPFWIANYNFFVEKIDDDWLFWQFTESALIDGIDGPVDVNIFNGSEKELKLLTLGR